jgi:hypothetical protein
MAEDDRSFARIAAARPERTDASTGLDPHAIGQSDDPQEDWGEPMGGEAVHSSNHARRPIRTEADRGQGAKTRQMNKDIISRRM